ncbi:hypothetical protein GOP47_0013822 [Adiantum capillus-veneris]|uniref:Cytochrome P450 n=1 Tax=Adiantum capillus-veneris TaxID=13818 RepID=A0A9D4UPG8_ADICA|nr:hypothetical protein GOP47_0013822 [Adiantum capillus-veneris]
MANVGRMHDWFHSYFSEEHRTVTLRTLAGRTMYLTVDPSNVEHILKTNFHNYPKGQRVHSVLQDFLGDGIFNADGETWKKHRKVASVEFSNKKLKQMSLHTFRLDALRLLHLLRHHTARPLDIQDLLMRMTMDSLCKVGFGVDLGNLSPSLPNATFGSAFDNVNAVIVTRIINPIWKIQRALNIGKERFVKANIKILNTFTWDVIQKRKADIQDGEIIEAREDLLSRFMKYNKGKDGAYSDVELRDSILNFMIAGRDTTAVALSWFLYCICEHPHVADKIYKEGLDVLGLQENHQLDFEEVAQKLDYESLAKMHYLHAALSETLRLYPPVPRDGKTVLKNDILPDGTHVEKGAQISYVPYSMGRMKFLWGPDALSYNPQRWLRDGVFQPESPFKFSAFQAGPRICLGKESAYLQMKITASMLLHFFKFSLVKEHTVKYRVMMVMPIANGLYVHVSPR